MAATPQERKKFISTGEKKMKVYKQMKMYNDESLNPILYKKNDKEEK